MSSLTNQQSSTKSLTGLSDTYSTNIVCDTFEVSQQFTIDPGCVITLPANSIPDSALSTNVALKNGANVFTNTNTFSLVGNQIRIYDPANVGQSTISQTGSSLNISSVTNNASPQTSMVLSTRTTLNGGCVLLNGNSSILNLGTGSASTTIVSPTLNLSATTTNLSATSLVYPAGGTAITGGTLTIANTQINNGVITHNAAINDYATREQHNEDRFIDATATTTNTTQMFQNSSGFAIVNIQNLQNIGFTTRNSLGTPLANIICRNGNRIQLQGTSAGEIDITNNIVTLSGICSFTNVTTPVITQAISLADNTTKIATTAYVKGQNYITTAALTPYALLAGTQTFTGTNTFALSGNEVEFKGGSVYKDLLGGTSSTLMNQTGIDCRIENTHDNGSIRLRTRDTLSGIPHDNVYALNGNTGGLQGDSGNVINITGTLATIGGTSVPVITTQPAIGSNTNQIASTKFVKDQLYATTASLSAYALLTANQTFTGTQTCVAANNVLPVKIQTQLVGYTGYSGGSLITDSGAFNPINLQGDYSVIGFGTAINTGGVLTLTTHSSTNCGIRITNNAITQTAPFTCGYLQLGTPITSKTNYQLGFINTILYAGFTGNAWATSSGAYNIMSIVWDGTGDYTLGVWQVEIVIISQCVNAPTISFNWNTLTATSLSLNLHSGSVSDAGTYAGVAASIFRMSFVLNVTDLLKSYFLNCSRVGGTALSSDANSYIKFTRLA